MEISFDLSIREQNVNVVTLFLFPAPSAKKPSIILKTPSSDFTILQISNFKISKIAILIIADSGPTRKESSY